MLTTGDTQDAHTLVIPQAGEQFGRDEEILARVLAAGDFDHAFVYHALVAWVHALVDLVNDSKRRLRHGLQRHQVEDGRDCPLAARLPVLVELLKRLVFPAPTRSDSGIVSKDAQQEDDRCKIWETRRKSGVSRGEGGGRRDG